MIVIEKISEDLVRLTSSEGGKVKDTFTGRVHSEVVCAKPQEGRFVEVVE